MQSPVIGRYRGSLNVEKSRPESRLQNGKASVLLDSHQPCRKSLSHGSCAVLRAAQCSAHFSSSTSQHKWTSRESNQMWACKAHDAVAVQGQWEDVYQTLPITEFMATPVFSLAPTATVFEAIELLVEKRVSGLPVVDADGFVLGVVSGFDIIAVDATPGGHYEQTGDLFPEVGRCEEFGGDRTQMWKEFMNVKEAAAKTNAQVAEEIMHDAVTIPYMSTIEDAAQIMFKKKLHRLCVVDERGILVGMLSRGDILKATLSNLKSYILDSVDDSNDST